MEPGKFVGLESVPRLSCARLARLENCVFQRVTFFLRDSLNVNIDSYVIMNLYRFDSNTI